MIETSIIGGSGYVGGELLRILLSHPKVRIRQVTSERFAEMQISLPHPNLRGTDLIFSKIEELENCDLLFIALPNGTSMKHMERFMKLAPRIIDCGADFRLKNKELWQKWYGTEHEAQKLIGKFVYGVPEIRREEIKKASHIASPGCEAITSILALYPLVRAGAIQTQNIIIDAKMSSSQAGNAATNSSHHPERAHVMRSYLPTLHRHTAEIEQELSLNGGQTRVLISATAVEAVRGLLVTVHAFLKNDLAEKDVWKIYREAYANEPFIRIVKEKQGLYRYPEPKILIGSNYCEIGFEKDPHSDRLVVLGAIDNLVKGEAGNCVQCMNLMFGFPEKTGLEFPGLHPI